MNKTSVAAVLALAAALATASHAQQAAPADHAAHHPPEAAAAASAPPAAPLAEGEVRRVDKAAGKITLRHGEIRSLDMPPMTMVFQVSDPALLDKVKAGDKVRFQADQAGGAYRVTDLQLAPQ